MLSHITNISREDFQKQIADKRIIIIYPRLHFHNVFLSYFLQDDQTQLIYLKPSEDNTPLDDFLRYVVGELQLLSKSAGKSLQSALDSNADADVLASALAKDLKAVAKGAAILYIDEFDRIELNDTLRSFISAFVSALADNIQFAVNSRLVTYEPWFQFVQEGQAVVIGTEHRSSDLLFSTEEVSKPQLEVYAFGRGHAIVNGQEITNWDGALPRNLFFYFVDNELVTRDEIFDVFWPNLNVKEATNVFHVTKRKITECISDKVAGDGNYELTQYGNGFYSPSTKVFRHYDVADFEAAVDKAAMTFDDDQQAKLYRRAIEIYKGPFLQTIDMPWVIERREKLQGLFIEALIGMGRIHKSAEEWEAALGYFIRALKENPNREDMHREVMQLYGRLGRKADALEQYRLLEDQLKATLGVAPDKATRELYDQMAAK